MSDTWLKSIVLIRSSNPAHQTFGTGFSVYREGLATTYIATCAHVVQDILSEFGEGEGESIMAADARATVIVSGFQDGRGIDLAVLRVEKVLDQLPLRRATEEDDKPFRTAGFQRSDKDFIKRELKGRFDGQIEIGRGSQANFAKAWDLKIESDHRLQQGYSGSPAVDEHGYVVAVINMREGDGSAGTAISIDALESIWPGIAPRFSEESHTVTPIVQTERAAAHEQPQRQGLERVEAKQAKADPQDPWMEQAREGYRRLVEQVWAKKSLSPEDLEQLRDYFIAKPGFFGVESTPVYLSPEDAAAIEREVMGDYKEAIYRKQIQLAHPLLAAGEQLNDLKDALRAQVMQTEGAAATEQAQYQELQLETDMINPAASMVARHAQDKMQQNSRIFQGFDEDRPMSAEQQAREGYRQLVEKVWAKKSLSPKDLEQLRDYYYAPGMFAHFVYLSPEDAAAIEREVMGDYKEAIYRKQLESDANNAAASMDDQRAQDKMQKNSRIFQGFDQIISG